MYTSYIHERDSERLNNLSHDFKHYITIKSDETELSVRKVMKEGTVKQR